MCKILPITHKLSKIVFLSTLLYILGAGGRKIVPRSLLMECKTFSPANQIARNKHNGGTLELFKYEPRHNKTNKMSLRLAKTQVSLGIRPV